MCNSHSDLLKHGYNLIITDEETFAAFVGEEGDDDELRQLHLQQLLQKVLMKVKMVS